MVGVTASAFTGGDSGLTFEASGSNIQALSKRIEINGSLIEIMIDASIITGLTSFSERLTGGPDAQAPITKPTTVQKNKRNILYITNQKKL